MSQALLLVDIQNDYFPGGAMELVGMEDAAPNASRLLATFRERGRPVVHVQHLSVRPGVTYFVPDTPGAEIHSSVAPTDDGVVFQKNFPNSFRQTGLKTYLDEQGIDDLVICGAMSHMCIDATARAAFDFGINCAVVEDACATRDLEFAGNTVTARDVHGAFMAALGAVYARVVGTGDIVAG